MEQIAFDFDDITALPHVNAQAHEALRGIYDELAEYTAQRGFEMPGTGTAEFTLRIVGGKVVHVTGKHTPAVAFGDTIPGRFAAQIAADAMYRKVQASEGPVYIRDASGVHDESKEMTICLPADDRTTSCYKVVQNRPWVTECPYEKGTEIEAIWTRSLNRNPPAYRVPAERTGTCFEAIALGVIGATEGHHRMSAKRIRLTDYEKGWLVDMALEDQLPAGDPYE